MQELMGRVTALDAGVTQSLKVISYFDALVSGGVNLETLVRGAASLTGAVAGLRAPGVAIRVGGDGRLLEDLASATADGWPSREADDASTVWLEREGDAHANDAMVLERLALAVAVLRARRRLAPDDALQAALDGSVAADVRAAALARLRLDGERLRAIATSPEATVHGPTTLIATPYGVLRASIARQDASPSFARAGLGTWAVGPALAGSWSMALAAYRLTDAATSVVDAEELGLLLPAALAAEASLVEHPDVARLAALDARSAVVLGELVRSDSVRSAANALHVHHSTLQSRHETLTRELGYDPRSAPGRARYELASLVLRLTS